LTTDPFGLADRDEVVGGARLAGEEAAAAGKAEELSI